MAAGVERRDISGGPLGGFGLQVWRVALILGKLDVRAGYGQLITAQINSFGQQCGGVVDHPAQDELALLLIGVVAEHEPGRVDANGVDAAGDTRLHRGAHVHVDLIEYTGAVLRHHCRKQHYVADPLGQQRHDS
jgi:hypothetical protein